MVFDFIRMHQLNIMLGLCSASLVIALLLLITKFVSKRRKWILLTMEFTATALLWFDRLAYIYSGDVSHKGYIMVRLSNFMVFFLTIAMVLEFNKFLIDLLMEEGITETVPLRLMISGVVSLIDLPLVIFFCFGGIYYTFDAQNKYQRGPGFLIAYVVPVIIPLIQLSVILKYRKELSRFIRIALYTYILLPIIAGIIQIFTYGISIVNMAMVIAFISMYIFTYLDINDEVERIHANEIGDLRNEQTSTYRLLDQISNAFVSTLERRDEYSTGKARRIATLAKKIAAEKGLSSMECEDVYYAALLHDVGVVSIPYEMNGKKEGFTKEEMDIIKQEPVVSAEILSTVTEYPQLAQIARHCYENYDGSGYPDGLAGEDIPLFSRIISVARGYDYMITPGRTSNAYPEAIVREELFKNSGILYDPEIADIMVKLMDSITNEGGLDTDNSIEEELRCGKYRDRVTTGIEVTEDVKKISFTCERSDVDEGYFSAPSIIVFDSFDRKIHSEERTIRSLKFLEYAEMWFDGHSTVTGAKNIKIETAAKTSEPDDTYEIYVSRFEDHMKIRMESCDNTVNAIIALPDKTKSAYIGITGENCYITGINIEETGDKTVEGDIPRIAEATSYIDRMESDVPNVQVDKWRSDATVGIPVADRLRIDFHSMSLPSASMVWHCPYIVLFHSDDKKVKGEDYREYAMVKTNGESDIENEYSKNRFILKKSDEFPGWAEWQEANRLGMEFKVEVRKKGDKVSIITENMGIYLENITTVPDADEPLYIALTGDQVALTDIRVR